MTEPSAAPAAPAADPAAAAPAAGAPTHVSQAPPTGYQPQTPTQQPTGVADPAKEPQTPANPQPAVEKAADPANPTPADPAAPEFKLPEEYKDKAWASKVKSLEDVYKQIDTLDSLKGKKMVVPNLKDASPEDREAFYAQMRGKDATEYTIPDNDQFKATDLMKEGVPKLFMDNGISPVQAEAVIKGYQELGLKALAAERDPEVFKGTMKQEFGEQWEPAVAKARNAITTMLGDAAQAELDTLPNSALAIMYRNQNKLVDAVNATLKKYGATESFAHLGAPAGAVQPNDMGAQRQAWRTELAALSMRPHEAAEKDAIIQKIADSYKNDPRLQAG